MKKLVFAAAMVFISGTFNATPTNAQVRVNVNIGAQPIWGPTGYDNAQNYYLPDVDAYFDVAAQLFYYNSGGRWISGPSLPPSYGNFDLYNSYKVVINKPHPWMNAAVYRRQYAGFKGRHNQPVIRDSRDQRYFANPNHPMHNQWKGGPGQGQHQQHGNGGGHPDHHDDGQGHRP